MLQDSPSHPLASAPTIGDTLSLSKGVALAAGLAATQDEFVMVEAGAFLLYASTVGGERFHLSIVGPGHVFTPESLRLLQHGQDRFGAEVLQDAKVRRITGTEWQQASGAHPDLYRGVIEQESKLLQIVQFHLAQHSQRSSLDKARFALCAYAQGLGLALPCGRRTIRVSRAELAAWIGVSTDRMCRIVRKLHAAGEVELKGRSITVSSGLLASLYP